MSRCVETSEGTRGLKADGGGGKKMEVKICDELELPWIRRIVGISFAGSDCGGGDTGRDVITSRTP